MKSVATTIVLLAFGLASASSAQDLSGYVAAEVRAFPNEALHPGQAQDNVSLVLEPELYYAWESGSSFTVVPFVRIDRPDARRSHFDIRELNMLWLGDSWELRVGIGKVFWGVTEFVHLVDIINQTDLVEHIDGEDKLGQPMVHLSLPRRWGVLDVFVLPYFRERTFPGHKGRLRLPLVVDTGHARYESDRKAHHIDFAIRYSHTAGDWDAGVHYFRGTGREPTLLMDVNEAREAVLIPYYVQINQAGLDLQRVAGPWLLKLEALYRTGQGDDFLAAVGGAEYTFFGLLGSSMDLGFFGDWAYDSRGNDATTVYENDAMLGLRLALNDLAGSELVAGVIHDVESSSRAFRLEASRRIGSRWRATLEVWAFLDCAEDDLLYSLRDDDFLRIGLAYYF